MKRILAFASLVLAAVSQAQTGSQETPDLIVLKFSCGHFEQGGSMVRSVADPGPAMNEPMRINTISRNEPQEVTNRRDMQERRADMKNAEINASLSSQPGSKLYRYRLKFKNAGSRPIKSFAWEYRPGEVSDPLDRQFFCAIKTKPTETKDLDLFSPLAPSRVVDASKAGDKAAKNSDGKVLINQIHYLDGSVWLRPGWNPKTFSEESTGKVENGKCIGL